MSPAALPWPTLAALAVLVLVLVAVAWSLGRRTERKHMLGRLRSRTVAIESHYTRQLEQNERRIEKGIDLLQEREAELVVARDNLATAVARLEIAEGQIPELETAQRHARTAIERARNEVSKRLAALRQLRKDTGVLETSYQRELASRDARIRELEGALAQRTSLRDSLEQRASEAQQHTERLEQTVAEIQSRSADTNDDLLIVKKDLRTAKKILDGRSEEFAALDAAHESALETINNLRRELARKRRAADEPGVSSPAEGAALDPTGADDVHAALESTFSELDARTHELDDTSQELQRLRSARAEQEAAIRALEQAVAHRDATVGRLKDETQELEARFDRRVAERQLETQRLERLLEAREAELAEGRQRDTRLREIETELAAFSAVNETLRRQLHESEQTARRLRSQRHSGDAPAADPNPEHDESDLDSPDAPPEPPD